MIDDQFDPVYNIILITYLIYVIIIVLFLKDCFVLLFNMVLPFHVYHGLRLRAPQE